jgi:hypothetical protein
MAKLVVLITARVEDSHRVGEAWRDAGAPGVTFIESYGLRSLQEASKSMEVLPGLVSMFEMLRQQDETSVIVLSLVDNETIVDALIKAAEDILGDLMLPNNGIAFVLDVARTIGVRDHGKE